MIRPIRTAGPAFAAFFLVAAAAMLGPNAVAASPGPVAEQKPAVDPKPARGPKAEPPRGVHTLVLVRHGWYDGDDPRDERTGKGLVPLGVAQARLTGSRLRALPFRFDEFLASPLTRARQTAALVAAEIDAPPPRIDDDLAECTPPTRRADVMAEETPESLAACAAQLDRLAARLLVATPAADRRTLVVAHGNVIRYLVVKALAVDPASWLGLSIGNASLTTIAIGADGAPHVIAVGDVGHLPPPLRSGAWGDAARELVVP